MVEALNEIYDNIYKSEEESIAQHEYLQKLKDKIASTEKKVEEIENQCQSVQADVARKIKRLANREVALLSMNVRNKCLQERTAELKAENRDLTKTLNELKSRLKASQDNLFKQSFEITDELGIFNQKQLCSFIPEDFPRDNKSYTEESHDKFLTACSSSVGNFASESIKANTENDNSWLWDIDLTEDDGTV